MSTMLQTGIQSVTRDVFFGDDTGDWVACSYRPTYAATPTQSGKRIILGAETPMGGADDGFTRIIRNCFMCDDATVGIASPGPAVNGYIDIGSVPWRISDVEGDGMGMWILTLEKGS